jgi:hypothetical protein
VEQRVRVSKLENSQLSWRWISSDSAVFVLLRQTRTARLRASLALLGRRTARNDAPACQDEPIAAPFLNSQDTPRPGDRISGRYLLRTIATVNHRDAVPYSLDAIVSEQGPRVVGSYEGSEQATPSHQGKERIIVSHKSGYVRYVDVAFLVEWAKTFGVQITLDRRVGHFVPAGAPLLRVVDAGRMTPEREARLLTAIDIGPIRTLQQDVEFGVIQIVDIALRAISPAVNDPTTAINCIDQLSRIMIVWTSRAEPPSCLYAPPYVLRVMVPWISYEGLLDTAFEQIRHCEERHRRESQTAARLRRHGPCRGLTPRGLQTTPLDALKWMGGRADPSQPVEAYYEPIPKPPGGLPPRGCHFRPPTDANRVAWQHSLRS